MSVTIAGGDNRLLDFDQQPLVGRVFVLPDIYASFSSGVSFAEAVGQEPRITSTVGFESVIGTASPAGPFTSGVQFNSEFEVIGGDLASGRYRR